jgi:hypothetical protein
VLRVGLEEHGERVLGMVYTLIESLDKVGLLPGLLPWKEERLLDVRRQLMATAISLLGVLFQIFPEIKGMLVKIIRLMV